MEYENTWDAYEAAYKHISPKIGEFMQAVASAFGTKAVEDMCSDDYGWCCTFEHNGIKYYAELTLNDAAAYGDAEPGQKGNLMLTVIRDGGQIVISYAPFNYTDQCWVPYTDHAELLNRVPCVEQVENVIVAVEADAVLGGEPNG